MNTTKLRSQSANAIPKEQPPKLEVGVLGAVDQLSGEEYLALLTDEQIIQDEFKNSLDVGLALADVRTRRLYRVEYASFPDYYRRKWHFEVNKVHYLTATAEVYRAITAATDLAKPENAFQLRPLLNLPPERARLAWEHAAKTAGAGRITASLVRAAVVELKFQPEGDPKQAELRRGRAARRQELTRAMADLLELITLQKPYDALMQKASLLDQHLRFFFPKPGKR